MGIGWRGRLVGGRKGVRPALRGHDGREIGDLLGDLRASSWLSDWLAWSAPVEPWLAVTSVDIWVRALGEVGYHAGLDVQGVLEGAERGLPALLGAGHQLDLRHGQACLPVLDVKAWLICPVL